MGSGDVLIDAPPTQLEVEFNVEVFYPKQDVYRPLGQVSPVVRTLAKEQFDNYVKCVRIFVRPDLAEEAKRLSDLPARLEAAMAKWSAP